MKNIIGSSFACIPQYAQKLDFIVIEEFCGVEKEAKLNELLRFNSKVQVNRTSSWKIDETYMCKLLQWYVSHLYLKADRGNFFILYSTRCMWCMDFNLSKISCGTDTNDSTAHRTSQIYMLDATWSFAHP